ncbi:MAG: hypothetical protein QI199_00665 [Candidatus Korarchaeota archaeon]|nr:hypothetical protein [Candidatus Korarchaeota archaeon]
MKPKHKVYYLRVALLSLVGLVSGIAGLTPMEGLSLFLLAYFLVTPLSLKLWGDELKDLGLMKLYREALGSSFLALLLIWTLVINLMGPGVPIYVVRASQGGIYPIQTIDGRIVGPGERPLAGYNAVYLKLTDHNIEDIYIGSYAKKGDLTKVILGRTEVTLSKGEIHISGVYNLSIGSDYKRMSKLLGNITIFVNGTLVINGTMKLNPGETKEFTYNSTMMEVSHTAPGVLDVEIDSTRGRITEYPVSVFISSIEEKEGYIFVFDSVKPFWKTRTARVDDSYVVVLPPG